MKTTTKEALKATVDAIKGKLPEDVVFIAGARAIKNNQIEFEFVQSRSLAGRRASLLALANEGDSRFNTGKTVMRAWMMVNEQGFKSLFGEIEDFDFAKAKELAVTLKPEERVAILAHVKTIKVDDFNQPLKIVCKETVDVNTLPKSIREQLLSDAVTQDIKDRYILQTGARDGKESEMIVDEFGNTVYRRYELSYGTDTDVLVPNKKLESEFKKDPATKDQVKDLLKGALAE